jgi:RNA polymerase sigma-70 factor (ECF subfamily)
MTLATAVPAPEISDEQLLARFAQGDPLALDELFRRYRGMAYRIAFRLLGREADALDAVQDGFIKALTHLDSFQGRSSFKTWLLRVVSNAALDLGRQRGRREAVSLDSLEGNEQENCLLARLEDPGGGLERAEMRRILDVALQTLSEAQRRTFLLHVDGGLNYREVADVLGISIGTVMSRLFYARRRLRAYLARWVHS